jgi:hypothetical protein
MQPRKCRIGLSLSTSTTPRSSENIVAVLSYMIFVSVLLLPLLICPNFPELHLRNRSLSAAVLALAQLSRMVECFSYLEIAARSAASSWILRILSSSSSFFLHRCCSVAWSSKMASLSVVLVVPWRRSSMIEFGLLFAKFLGRRPDLSQESLTAFFSNVHSC